MSATKTYHLTNKEIVSQLSLRDDLNELESDLLDRLVRATDEIERLERASPEIPTPHGAISP